MPSQRRQTTARTSIKISSKTAPVDDSQTGSNSRPAHAKLFKAYIGVHDNAATIVEKREINKGMMRKLLAGKAIPTFRTLDELMKRVARLFTKYREIERKLNGTGLGLTEKGIRGGSTSIEQKCDFECPGFVRLSTLHGDRSNTQPVWLAFHGATGGTEYTFSSRKEPTITAIAEQTRTVFARTHDPSVDHSSPGLSMTSHSLSVEPCDFSTEPTGDNHTPSLPVVSDNRPRTRRSSTLLDREVAEILGMNVFSDDNDVDTVRVNVGSHGVRGSSSSTRAPGGRASSGCRSSVGAHSDYSIRNKRIKMDFSSEYRESQSRNDEMLRENSQREFELGMKELLVTSLWTNAFRRTSFTEIDQHLVAFRQLLTEPLENARGNEETYVVRSESKLQPVFDGKDDFSYDASEVVDSGIRGQGQSAKYVVHDTMFDPPESINNWVDQFDLNSQCLGLAASSWSSLKSTLIQTYGIPPAKYNNFVRGRLEAHHQGRLSSRRFVVLFVSIIFEFPAVHCLNANTLRIIYPRVMAPQVRNLLLTNIANKTNSEMVYKAPIELEESLSMNDTFLKTAIEQLTLNPTPVLGSSTGSAPDVTPMEMCPCCGSSPRSCSIQPDWHIPAPQSSTTVNYESFILTPAQPVYAVVPTEDDPLATITGVHKPSIKATSSATPCLQVIIHGPSVLAFLDTGASLTVLRQVNTSLGVADISAVIAELPI
ncbi:uncharacterized protein EV154DRAFT_569519 [Mucor mucedo]|uniref:uncharacterized protein n=1 Tax=Mucor mucedo TaxID=29922 RepID=UPI00221EB797|nr:uncharacterized protein EV154DRAFT_569519 [Mucor mucedo]KAI7875437.1 hypothetical protein EV154DRAFT_569519 [Mucor mucedo]